MPRTRLGRGSSQDRQGDERSTDAILLGIDTEVFELLSTDHVRKTTQSEPRIEQWLDCWRNP
ncbi:hypothetical protein [Haloarcula sp. CBA1127]|uniref:hypothetical protein n=1 Tax=Haloarcula sp. CBA1127 TaxID=1765055 RepID=UPI00073EE3DE|nr:hypothetical protein [Haloarcula sp. CBA1127]